MIVILNKTTRLKNFRFSITSLKLYSALPALLDEDSNAAKTLTNSELKTLVLSQCSRGKFYDLIRNVVASPSVILTACQNLKPLLRTKGNDVLDSTLFDSVSSLFSVHEMVHQLHENRFDIEGCCIKMMPSRKKGDSLVLPNLKLKVLTEAIRMVLEVVYNDRFATFSYGGRPGLGRHTAIRYLKNTVENPTWWFTVVLDRQDFASKHVDKLCLMIEEKIKDKMLIDIIKRLFELKILQIELGGCYLGKGLPQECSLSSVLINVYFDKFDKETQELRLHVNKENPRIDSDELSCNAFYNRTKVYAVRYLDEILLISSGSKMFTMDLKNQLLKHLETVLELKVDRLETAIHSTVKEKIEFVGMELQAVPPSVLHPPMSEKAIRARKKYLRQKQVKSMEMRNARERNRKKLGMKLLRHAFKKLNQREGFTFGFHIEDEVGLIFRTWADKVVQEFLESGEDKFTWHRMLSFGTFLSLRHIRDQLPRDLVDSYDKFQEQVDQHLNPGNAKKALEEEEKMIEEEEQKYAERTVEDLTRLCMKVVVPIKLIRKAVKLAGFTNKMGRPRPIKLLIALEDADIIKWYAGVAIRWLEFFCCCHNFAMVKTIVTYHLRFSCILTLAEKHESTKQEAIRHYTKDLRVIDMNGDEETHFPTEREVKMMGDGNLSDPKPVDGIISMALIRLACDESPHSCIAHFCSRTDTILYRVRLLQNRLNVNPLDEEKWVPRMGAIHESLNKKCFPLCSDHANDLYMGKITLMDIDCTSFVVVE